MKRSTDAIITTHTGSLPRPDDLVELLYATESDTPRVDQEQLAQRVRRAVAEIVQQQLEAGIDIVNDGEMSKVSYSTYVSARLSGFDSHVQVQRYPRADAAAFPRYAEWNAKQQQGAARIKRFACTGPVTYVGEAQLQADIANLTSATPPGTEAFMTAASPGVISWFQPNQYYPTEEQYLQALAEAMREEYAAIIEAGLVLQVDCPDITLSRNVPPGVQVASLGQRIEALNAALADLPADRMRLHLCWGNYEGPHQTDVPLRDIIGEVFLARPMAISFEGANPRHEHEYALFSDVDVPPDKVIIPGVLDSTTNYIEHPELVCQRLVRYAQLVGPEQLIAGTDCGFGTFAGTPMVHPDIVFAKLQALVEGAHLASQKLYK
ncbi:MAG TPA: cobalamin-independent methionine synthase II family protein [Ktedonobacterales bacterium]|nr:cobalamin-independent methionine synthase II family protein [Ktedonobacterales bacterium]